ncbi:hypothetical protein TNCV_4488731 [Trichonephila clavipes]|nr:hypothetical protein TNCV_4488731 [Trichonephila clavipes]
MVVSGALGLVVSRDQPRRESDLWMYPLHHGQKPYKIQTAPDYYYKTDELLRCFNKITTLRTSSLDVPPCTMSRTPTRFKQHRVTTTRPMNCYAVSTRLRRSTDIVFFSLPSGRGQPFVTRSP